jgi:hypothetical protein
LFIETLVAHVFPAARFSFEFVFVLLMGPPLGGCRVFRAAT